MVALTQAACAVLQRGDSAQPHVSRPAAFAVYQAVSRSLVATGAAAATLEGAAADSESESALDKWVGTPACQAVLLAVDGVCVRSAGELALDAAVRTTLHAAAALLRN
jgi:hypothetical protein